MSTNPSPEAVKLLATDDATIDWISRYGARCRECADNDGVCPANGLPCGAHEPAIRHVLNAINYGVQYGYVRASSETLAKVEAEREALQRQLDLYKEALSFDCTGFPGMEEKAIEWANHIAGPKGQLPYHPDPVGILEMCEDIAKPARDFLARTTKEDGDG